MRGLKELFWSWAVVPIGLVATGVYALSIMFFRRRDPGAPSVERLLKSWAHLWIRLARIDLEVEGGDELDQTTSYVVVVNHLSNYDIMVCAIDVVSELGPLGRAVDRANRQLDVSPRERLVGACVRCGGEDEYIAHA